MLKYLACALIFFSSLAKPLSAEEPDSLTKRGFVVNVGDMAPLLPLILADGGIINTGDLKGKVVVLQFTASWCSVCRKEMPHLQSEIWDVHRDDDFMLIGIDLKEPDSVVRQFARDMKITYPLALDPDGSHFAAFAHPRSGVTRNVVIDKKGRIAFLTRLYDIQEFEEMKAVINRLLIE